MLDNYIRVNKKGVKGNIIHSFKIIIYLVTYYYNGKLFLVLYVTVLPHSFHVKIQYYQ